MHSSSLCYIRFLHVQLSMNCMLQPGKIISMQTKKSWTNDLAVKVKNLFDLDSLISYRYNHDIANGNGITKWIRLILDIPMAAAGFQYNTESVHHWGSEDIAKWGLRLKDRTVHILIKSEAILPEFDNFGKQSYYLEIYNRGNIPFDYKVSTGKPWIQLEKKKGTIEKEERIMVSVDWKKVPKGIHRIPINISGPKKREREYLQWLRIFQA